MSPELVRRFSRLQIILHWVIALQYITLLVSGGIIMAVHWTQIDPATARIAIAVHNALGISLLASLTQLFLAAVASRQLSMILKDMGSWLRFGLGDVKWLVVAPVHLFMPRRVLMPPAGRYNAGQKIHGIFILLVVPAFAATGLMMLLRTADLRPWVVHSRLFFAACGFLAIHLFLSLINPPTRKALRGIFTGHVSREYASRHHPLEHGISSHAHGEPVVSLWAAVTTAVVAAAIGAAVAWYTGPQRLHLTGPAVQENTILEPGPLVSSHANDLRTARCQACHVDLKRPSNASCLGCHDTIKQVLAAKQGYHGQLTGRCRNCHVEHQGANADLRGLDQHQFNHQLARFALDGRHQTIECRDCHLKHSPVTGQLRYIGLTFDACVRCHANPHQISRLDDCQRCHSVQGWDAAHLKFDHQRDTSFVLDGRHAKASCDACHSPTRRPTSSQPLHRILAIPAAAATTPATAPSRVTFQMEGIGRTCNQCHADPHVPTLGSQCDKCHRTDGWTGRSLLFVHNRDTSFRLEDAHAALDCRQCHAMPSPDTPLALAKFVGTSATCSGCHADPHRGQLSQQCTNCHRPTRWTGREMTFQHNRDSTFLLRGAHEDLACDKCHQPIAATSTGPSGARDHLASAQFKPLLHTCADCHRDPHEGQFDRSCLACHTEQGFGRQNLQFVHNRDSRFKLDADHQDVACASCHEQSPTRTIYRGTSTLCQQCHTDIAEAIAGGRADKPDPHQDRVQCADCHRLRERKSELGDYADACQHCHNQTYRSILFQWQQSLDRRKAQLLDKIAASPALTLQQTQGLNRRVEAASHIGAHNTQAAIRQLDQLDGEIAGH